ncbi:MAG: FtsX-like permease family protein [Lentisphaerae bacterium]|jgi:putative ABC transport system permease protein|nr:FtsX-like permease family protein [Lentisphaerota bacterium]MBT4816658.1 FtsX-like permease family protein [Lentisphaerota bacterium]MBT5606385.1 FtsX-like permease family protein [Lentisphaerota bacterium]MBT7056760.1 FtsX-like permease family protein [Lentisphaerota bacterium]MBT7840365.1 FtsX-like permease family protein [Lentisphaerota bacterium]
MSDSGAVQAGTSGGTLHGRIGRQRQLPFRNAVKIAWQSIRVRLARSLLVTSGIILALAFLAYILCSDALQQSIIEHGSAKLLEELRNSGVLVVADADARIQTRWMIGLALLVSFVGVLNAMLLSVTERFREIGTMKCLGALDRLIVQLFLLESTFQGIVGTSLGIVLGVVLTLLEAMGLYGSAAWGLIPVGEFLVRVVVCLLAGTALTVFGALYPARVASRMQPVDAMRSEV